MPVSISPGEASQRKERLSKYFNSVVDGNRGVQNTRTANLFLEAICDQDSCTNCVERLAGSSNALESLRLSFRYDVSVAFLNGHASTLLNYLSDPIAKQLCSGQLLQQIVRTMIDPPTFWKAFCKAFDDHALNEDATHAFAWLLMELFSSTTAQYNIDVQDAAEKATNSRILTTSPSHEIRTIGHKLEHAVQLRLSNVIVDSAASPGGRHDNDFADFRQIAILPTADEFMSKEEPFYRQADAVMDVDIDRRAGVHLDNQFRLLREDLLGELRNDLQVAQGLKKGRRPAFIIRGLTLDHIDCGDARKRKPCGLALRCASSFPQLKSLNEASRKNFISSNKNFLKHQSFGCLLDGPDFVAFATLDRNEELLAQEPPAIVLQVSGEPALDRALLMCKESKDLHFLVVDTPVFAYEPILKCLQDKAELSLAEELLRFHPERNIGLSNSCPSDLINSIENHRRQDLSPLLETQRKIKLDGSQHESLLRGLQQRVALIQGPPGTGKSFIGALLAKLFFLHTKEKILVLSYTNHALDQFLEDLLDMEIPQDAIVRLGAKSTARTKPLNLYDQSSSYKHSNATWNTIGNLESEADEIEADLKPAVAALRHFKIRAREFLELLEFSDEEIFFEALSTPREENGMTRVRENGKIVGPDYLFNRWSYGHDAGVYRKSVSEEHAHLWSMDLKARQSCLRRWSRFLLQEKVGRVSSLTQRMNACQTRLSEIRGERDTNVLKQKRIIGCTTTAAAKYARGLQNANPGIVLVEEAGEILETHILTSMGTATKQLILIGDHQQLRPKVNNYALTIEKGDGYDLNVSLFERLVHSAYPHTTLQKQHRMCTEISSLVRRLTYPDLEDAPKTLNRPGVRGLRDRVIFVNHGELESDVDIADRRDQGAKSSKQNPFEADMVVKCVKFLAQQGYGTDKQVILTPYLAQLHLLRDRLSRENDPVLNDIDSFDLIRAGLLTPAGAQVSKRPIRIATVDNYQGEESDIVIVSLTRANEAADIGFLRSPQRLNVLLSRARNALIIIGNADTFMRSRQGKDTWIPFMEHLKQLGHIYDGIPARCEQHPNKHMLLRRPIDFENECPDGGCSEPCGAQLNCDVHTCPQKCHQLSNHSKVQCRAVVNVKCSRSHNFSHRCYEKNAATCRKCINEDRRQEKIRERDHKLDSERASRQQRYAQQLAEIQDEIAHERRLMRDKVEEDEQKNSIEQHKKDLSKMRKALNDDAKKRQSARAASSNDEDIASMQPSSPEQPLVQAQQSTSECNDDTKLSEAQTEWERQKRIEGADNEALDDLMRMTGLEELKEQFLSIKAKVDTTVRQGIDMKGERFSAALLGNPGTGKTTVARLYARFLTSVGALPGDFFVETTGSRLANDSVPGCKKHIEDILNNGGGALFIDEAYQLTSGQSFGGGTVLDFLLVEVENLTGKVVFIIAGYNKQMESFFAHNPGIPSRFPHTMQFADYSDGELLQIFRFQVEKKFKGRMKVEEGLPGLYCRIVARRIGRGRGRPGFGNARTVQNVFSQVTARQSKRLTKERRAGKQPDDFLLTKEDLIGPEPSKALDKNPTWARLQKMTGLDSVKQSVRVLLDNIQTNYGRELDEKPIIEFSLNRVFLGSPGTGKTTVAKLYGQILADLGLLSNGEVVVKNPSDFVGGVLGQSEQNTKGILASTVGKVLVIDEAYGLYGGGGSGSGAVSDPYKSSVVDTIVAEVQSVPGDDRCVLLLGYQDQMEQMFQNVNPGLTRRFPLDSAFVFEDFTDEQLLQILNHKLTEQAFQCTDQAKHVALDMLRRARNRPNFGNAGEIDILLNSAKAKHQQRLSAKKTKRPDTLEPLDFDEDFERGDRAATNVPKLFEGVVGCEDVIAQLQGYQNMAKNMKNLDMDPRDQIPFNFLFRGPPGTGKTSTARKIGKVYYDMGFLANCSVVECSATELVGEYLGQTGPKTQKLLEKALGKVLFIDEAYRLADGPFAKEAMDEIVDCLTKPKFAGKLITILAGYDADINRLMSMNPGLTSRFPEAVVFKPLPPENCFDLLTQLLRKKKNLSTSALSNPTEKFHLEIIAKLDGLSKLANWANARDVQTISKAIFGDIFKSANSAGPNMVVTEECVLKALNSMLSERSQRAEQARPNNETLSSSNPQLPPLQQRSSDPRPQAPISIQYTTKAEEPLPSSTPQPKNQLESQLEPRDQGISDAVWQQLQLDKKSMEAREKAYNDLIKLQKQSQANAVAAEEKAKATEALIHKRLQEAAAAEIDDAKRKWEEARIAHELARRAREEELAELERQRKEAEERRRLEAKAQAKLRAMGVCPVGYRWIKQTNGYRCAGGSHFVTDAQLGL
ncbi:MAG: hypothetical protein M1820_001756 [Bogoriella megaspora]|nr:MAG: hypothetical protein M1820_001756 [Bogoriella megaspora]